MWRDDQQRISAIKILLGPVGMAHFWRFADSSNGAGSGPSEENWALYEKRQLPGWSHGELVMYQLGWVLWNGGEKKRRPNADEILHVLDGTNLGLVGTFFAAFAESSMAIDRWIVAHTPEAERPDPAVVVPLKAVPHG